MASMVDTTISTFLRLSGQLSPVFAVRRTLLPGADFTPRAYRGEGSKVHEFRQFRGLIPAWVKGIFAPSSSGADSFPLDKINWSFTFQDHHVVCCRSSRMSWGTDAVSLRGTVFGF